MKTWENPDIIKLDVTETASGGLNKKEVDNEWDETHEDGTVESHITYNSFNPSSTIRL